MQNDMLLQRMSSNTIIMAGLGKTLQTTRAGGLADQSMAENALLLESQEVTMFAQ